MALLNFRIISKRLDSYKYPLDLGFLPHCSLFFENISNAFCWFIRFFISKFLHLFVQPYLRAFFPCFPNHFLKKPVWF